MTNTKPSTTETTTADQTATADDTTGVPTHTIPGIMEATAEAMLVYSRIPWRAFYEASACGTYPPMLAGQLTQAMAGEHRMLAMGVLAAVRDMGDRTRDGNHPNRQGAVLISAAAKLGDDPSAELVEQLSGLLANVHHPVESLDDRPDCPTELRGHGAQAEALLAKGVAS